MRRRVGLLVAVLLIGAVDEVVGQRRGSMGGRPEMEERLRRRFDAMVRQQLRLTDAQVSQFHDVMEGFREQRQGFVQDEQRARRELMRLGDMGDLTDEAASAALRELLRLREEEVRLYRAEQEALEEVLTARQLLRFVVMREQLHQRIQGIRAGGARGMGPPPGRRPGPG